MNPFFLGGGSGSFSFFFFAEGCGLLTIALAAELKQLDGVLVSFLQGKIFDTRWVIDWIMILHYSHCMLLCF